MLAGLAVLALFTLVAWLLVKFVRTLYATLYERRRPVDRIWVVMGGYLAACIGAAIVVSLGLLMKGILRTPVPTVWSGGLVVIILLPLMLPFVAGFIAVYALLPAGVIIICADLARIRSPLFYGPAGAGAAALTYAFFDVGELAPFPVGTIGGLAGGLTYWRIAGRSAGPTSNIPEVRSG